MAAEAPVNPASPSAEGGRGRRLPILVRVPERDELLAMALATLAIGLVLGLAIGPGLGNAGRILPLISPPLAQLPTSPEVSDDGVPSGSLPVLSAPAGSDSAAPLTAPAVAAPAVVATTTAPVGSDPPAAPAPSSPAVTPQPVTRKPGEPEAPNVQTLPITGTVLASSVNRKSYSLADSSGNLQTIFSDFPPDPGAGISTEVLPLVNGTFSEYGGRRTTATRERTTVRGMVSYVDAQLGILVLSNRGTSLPLDGKAVSAELLPADPDDPDAPPPLGDGDWVEVDLLLADPEQDPSRSGNRVRAEVTATRADDIPAEGPALSLRIEALERLDETATSIELTGRLLELDRRQARLLMSADSVGLLAGTIEITTPPGFDFAGVGVGRVYSATVRRNAAGGLRLTGFSPGYSVRAADDPAEVFGEQGF